MSTLADRVALITGGSRGIGAALARTMVAEGAKVGLLSRSGDDLDLSGALGIACDVRNPEDVQRAVDATVERFGRLDIVIANAGVGSYGPFLNLSLDDIEEMIDVNLKGTLYAARAALPHLLQSARPTLSRSHPRRAGAACRTRRCTARPSSGRWGSPAHSTTSFAPAVCGVPTCAPVAWPPGSRTARAGRPRTRSG